MRFITIGYGVQGKKRTAIAQDSVVAIVDPFAPEATYKSIREVPSSLYDAAFVCTPDEEKFDIISYVLKNNKHILVEKPLLFDDPSKIKNLEDLCITHQVTCYTAYNHRFEPHFIKMKDIIQSGILGKIYTVRFFYGNGTARLVRNSPWRDKGYGVLADLGSHLLDTFLFWFDSKETDFSLLRAEKFENNAFDYVTFVNKNSTPFVQFEMSLLCWRNHFTADIYGEKGSAHISSLCKWGPSTFTLKKRILPSGVPPEESVTLIQPDPTWQEEYTFFKNTCKAKTNNLSNDIWIQDKLKNLFSQISRS